MNLRITRLSFIPLALVIGGCAHAGTQPHEMSAPEHEAAAAQEEANAADHAEQHDPAVKATEERCSKGQVCWTVTTNPTAGHGKSAEEHRALAEQHRAASQALRDAEAKACAGLSEADRDMSPFAHDTDIASVSQLKAEKKLGKATSQVDVGATIVFRAIPGLTQEWLQRTVDCHLARNAAVGHDMAEMPYCPLVPKGAKASVRSVGDGFAVDVQSDDPAGAAEIWRRAQQIKSTS